MPEQRKMISDYFEGVIESPNQLFGMIDEIKRTNRRYITNSYLDENDWALKIESERVYFHYITCEYLNIFIQEWDYFRLYFFIADLKNYLVNSERTIVADVFYRKREGSLNETICGLKAAGFSEYANFIKYTCNKVCISNSTNTFNVTIKESIEEGFYELLIECFDKYTDYIPEEHICSAFLNNRTCYSAVDRDNNLIGGAVITIRGQTATEEFIFIRNDYRRKGLSNQIRNKWMMDVQDYITKYVSWVREDNIASWQYLTTLGFKKELTNKTTMKKG